MSGMSRINKGYVKPWQVPDYGYELQSAKFHVTGASGRMLNMIRPRHR